MYIWSRIKYFLARMTPNNLVEFYMMLRMPKKAASFLTAKFDQLAPKEVRRASGDYRQKKWDFMGATKYFLCDCKPPTVVAILNEWYKGSPADAFKPGVIVNMMLTIPHNIIDKHMKKEEKKAIVDKIITLIAITNKDLLAEPFAKGPLSAPLEIMQVNGRDNPNFMPAFIPFLNFDLPERKLAVLFVLLEKSDPGQMEFIKAKLPNPKALSVLGLMNTIKIGMKETEKKLKDDSKSKKRTARKEESLTALFESLSKIIDDIDYHIESPQKAPEDEKTGEEAEA